MSARGSDGSLTEQRTGLEPTRSSPHRIPAVDISEAEDSLVLMMDMPGVAQGDVDISLERGVLSVFGQARQRKLDEGFTPLLAEYGSGHYQRSFQLSEDVEVDGIEATMKDGVLRLIVPKSSRARTRKIQVRGG